MFFLTCVAIPNLIIHTLATVIHTTLGADEPASTGPVGELNKVIGTWGVNPRLPLQLNLASLDFAGACAGAAN